jgi:hypothetical protein
VSWQETPDYVGWSPRFPSGYSASVPGGAFLYVPAGQLAATDLRARAQTAAAVGAQLGTPAPVSNLARREGVTFDRGPSIEKIERLAGPLPRVKIEDVVGAETGAKIAPPAVKKPEPRSPAAEPAGTPARSPDIEVMRRAGAENAREARAVTEQKAAPPTTIGVVRLVPKREAAPGAGRRRETPRDKAAPADSTK